MAEEKIYRVNENSLKAIADAIREKNAEARSYSVEEMPAEIRKGSVGAYIQDGDNKIYLSGEYNGFPLSLSENGYINLRNYIQENQLPLDITIETIVPTGTLDINTNGSYNVKEYEFVNVNIDTRLPEQQKEINYDTNGEYTVEPDEGYVLNKVDIKVNVPIPEGYIIPSGNIEITNTDEVDVTNYAIAQIKDENLKPENIAENVEVLGITGTFRGGIDTGDATATSDDLLLGKTAYANEQKLVGTIEDYDGSNSEALIPNEDFNAILSNEELESYTNNFVKSIGQYKFRNGKLKKFNSTSCLKIEGQAFYESTIEECNTPEITSVGSSAFQACQSLKRIYFPKITGTINSTAFTNCINLTYAHIGAPSLINNYVFQGCSKLKAITITSTQVPTLSAKDVFKGTPIEDGTGFIYVENDMVEQFKAATNWSTYASQIKPLSEYEEVE